MILKKELIFGGYQGPQSIHTQSANDFLKNINDKFNTTFIMDVTSNNDLASSLIDKTINKEIHSSYLLSSYYEKIIPEIKLLDLPYLFKNRNEAYKLLETNFFKYINDILKKNNLTLLGFWDNGVRHLSSKIKSIIIPDDCENQVLRTTPSPLHINIFKSIGFIPKPLDVRDFKIAIKEDTIDAQENPLTNYWNFGIYKKQKFVTLSSHMIGFCLFVINSNYFEELTIEEKKCIINSSKKSNIFQRTLAINEDDILIEKIKGEGIKISNLSEDNLNQFKKLTQVFHEQYFQEFPQMKKFI
jgi:TRAP-type C4-dicarboxylate transport system substrate-binding protein